jgi:5-methylcytosine-specific restriction endonuclease McrA
MKSKRSKRWNAESTLKISGKNNPCYKSGMYARSTSKNAQGQREFLRVRNEMRAKMILKHGFLFCEKCNTTETYQWEMHHLIYRSEKPLHEHLHNPINLINLCMKCHNWFHKNKSNRNNIVESRKLYELFGDDVRDKKFPQHKHQEFMDIMGGK